ncbi:hypothetical protein Agub_g248 [Astrephomene gubernaculifera]|uniref:GRF-type domain-containing protein n=1 Tax=Astrephomene gubernaculifera TaxID=47775 RepID=A0AAD3DDC6_9CHLO|nr:hypothetical protein Agub_g248 [Astrephomene gubernaculifera]
MAHRGHTTIPTNKKSAGRAKKQTTATTERRTASQPPTSTSIRSTSAVTANKVTNSVEEVPASTVNVHGRNPDSQDNLAATHSSAIEAYTGALTASTGQVAEATQPSMASHPASPMDPSEGPSTSGRDAEEPQAKRARLLSPFRGPGTRNLPRQVHDFFLVLDLEATCTKRRDLFPVEIIEVSAVLLPGCNPSLDASLGEFQSYVRPTVHPTLDPFCVELTGIQQDQVDSAPLLSDVLLRFQGWLAERGALREGVSLLPVTWTDWDLKICLETECEWRQLARPPYLRRWCNLKRLYTNRYRRTSNLRKCVEALGLRWQGQEHSGLDDSRNTAALLGRMVQDGCVLRVTDSFKEGPQQEHLGGTGQQQSQGSQPRQQQAADREQQQQQLPDAPVHINGGDEVGEGGRSGGGSKGMLRQTVLTLTPARSSAATAAASSPPQPPHSVIVTPPTVTQRTTTPTAATAAAPTTGASEAATVVAATTTTITPSSPTASSAAGPVTVAAVATAAAVELPLYDNSGRWLGRCRCGVAAHFRTTKKPGANLGRQFYSCGRWSISDRSKQCDFFVWADQLELAPGVGAAGKAGRDKGAPIGKGQGSAGPSSSGKGNSKRRGGGK